VTKNQANCRSQRTRQLLRLAYRSLRVLYHKVFPAQKWSPRDQYQFGDATVLSLLRGCAADFGTAFHRIGRRIDALPNFWSSPFGRSEVDPIGNLRPDTQTLGCMRDMQRSESDFPNATGFDWEMYRFGWEAGAKWCENNPCSQGRAGIPCDSPGGGIISNLPHHAGVLNE
jgi:hypothetical protein